MLNYWWVTRPKRNLTPVPELLAVATEISYDTEWAGQTGTHISLEEALEKAGLKRVGERRDQRGSGGRTHMALLKSLGLVFKQETTNKLMLTLAGEAIMTGESPVAVIRNQILKYQFPSSYTSKGSSKVHERFKIRPFRFMLRLLSDSRIMYLTQEEIGKIIIVEAETESDKCYEHIVERIHEFRDKGDACIDPDFERKYTSFTNANDIANTVINWLEYTQYVGRENKQLKILEDKQAEVDELLSTTPPFIDRPTSQEYYQRKYGVDPNHKKDTRNLLETKSITPAIIAEQKIKRAYISEALKRPIAKITPELIDTIVERTGFHDKVVEETLLRLYPRGSVNAFMAEYFEMAFKSREEATEFEKATVELFRDVFGYETKHVGPIGLTPDVLLLSDSEGYQAIIDNKAYPKYTISNDHHNRMVHNYIANLSRYSDSSHPLAFFSYIAGGFGKNFDSQVKNVVDASGVSGSGITVANMIKLVECYDAKGYTHKNLRDIFSVNRQILLGDFFD